MKGNNMRIDKWIEKTGPKKVAQLLNVDASTVSNWRTGKRFPSSKNLFAIRRLSKGKVTVEETLNFHLHYTK
jgi:DNA-binding transcriptional regulator YdaS (Cro superfamily)